MSSSDNDGPLLARRSAHAHKEVRFVCIYLYNWCTCNVRQCNQACNANGRLRQLDRTATRRCQTGCRRTRLHPSPWSCSVILMTRKTALLMQWEANLAPAAKRLSQKRTWQELQFQRGTPKPAGASGRCKPAPYTAAMTMMKARSRRLPSGRSWHKQQPLPGQRQRKQTCTAGCSLRQPQPLLHKPLLESQHLPHHRYMSDGMLAMHDEQCPDAEPGNAAQGSCMHSRRRARQGRQRRRRRVPAAS